MTYFNEENTVEQMVLDALCGRAQLNMIADEIAPYGDQLKDWKFIPAEQLQRQFSDVFVESMVRDALIRLNPEIKTQPDRAPMRYSIGSAQFLFQCRAKALCVPMKCLPSGCEAKNPCPLVSAASTHRLN